MILKVTRTILYDEGNDNDPITGVFSSPVGVNHMLEMYMFRKPDLEYSVSAHPLETNMKLQG